MDMDFDINKINASLSAMVDNIEAARHHAPESRTAIAAEMSATQLVEIGKMIGALLQGLEADRISREEEFSRQVAHTDKLHKTAMLTLYANMIAAGVAILSLAAAIVAFFT